MKKIVMTAILCLLLVGASAVVWAADYNAHFGDMDTSGDDLVVWDEFKVHFPEGEQSVFDGIAGEDQAIDHDEWHEFKETKGYGHIEGKQEKE